MENTILQHIVTTRSADRSLRTNSEQQLLMIAKSSPKDFLKVLLSIIGRGTLENRYTSLVFLRNMLTMPYFFEFAKNESMLLLTLIGCLCEKGPIGVVSSVCFCNYSLILDDLSLIESLIREILFLEIQSFKSEYPPTDISKNTNIISQEPKNNDPQLIDRIKNGGCSVPAIQKSIVENLSQLFQTPETRFTMYRNMLSSLITFCTTIGCSSTVVSLICDIPLLHIDLKYQISIVDAFVSVFSKVPHFFLRFVSFFYTNISNLLIRVYQNEHVFMNSFPNSENSNTDNLQSSGNVLKNEKNIEIFDRAISNPSLSNYINNMDLNSRNRLEILKSLVSALTVLATEYPQYTTLQTLQQPIFNCLVFCNEPLTLQILEFFTTLSECELKSQVSLVSTNTELLKFLLNNLKPTSDTHWTVHKASVVCLESYSKCCNLLSNFLVNDFILKKFVDCYEIGLMCLGSIVCFSFYSEDCYYDYFVFMQKYKPDQNCGTVDTNDGGGSVLTKNVVYSKDLVLFLRFAFSKILTVLSDSILDANNKSTNPDGQSTIKTIPVLNKGDSNPSLHNNVSIDLPDQKNIHQNIANNISQSKTNNMRDQSTQSNENSAHFNNNSVTVTDEGDPDGLFIDRQLWCLSKLFQNNGGSFDIFYETSKLFNIIFHFLKRKEQLVGVSHLLMSFFEASQMLVSADCFENGFAEASSVNNFHILISNPDSGFFNERFSNIPGSHKSEAFSKDHKQNAPSKRSVLSPFYTELAGTIVSTLDSPALTIEGRHALTNCLCELIKVGRTSDETQITIKISDWHIQKTNQYTYLVQNEKNTTNFDTQNTDQPPNTAIIEQEAMVESSLKILSTAYLKIGDRGFGHRRQELLNTIQAILYNKNTSLTKTAYQTLTDLCRTQNYFSMHCDQILERIQNHLNTNDLETVNACCTFISQACTVLVSGIMPFAKQCIPTMFNSIKNQKNKYIKPILLNTISCLALSLGKSYELFTIQTINLLKLANQMDDPESNYRKEIQIACTQLASSFILAIGNTQQTLVCLRYVEEFLVGCLKKSVSLEVVNACIRCLGDLIAVFGDIEQTKWMQQLLIKYASDPVFEKEAKEALSNL